MEAPAGVVGTEGFQATVADAEQPDVFEVGLDDTPAAPQVFVKAVFGQFGEGAENVRGSRQTPDPAPGSWRFRGW